MLFTKNKSDTSTQNQLVNLFSALGDKTRFKLLNILSRNDQLCVSELAEEIGISNAGVSQQLQVLEKAGLIARNRQGQKICYTIRQDNDINKKLLKLIG